MYTKISKHGTNLVMNEGFFKASCSFYVNSALGAQEIENSKLWGKFFHKKINFHNNTVKFSEIQTKIFPG